MMNCISHRLPPYRGTVNFILAQLYIGVNTGGSELSGDWRPTVLALGMLVVFLLIVVLPGVRAFFSLTPLDDTTYLLIAGAVILWGLLQRWLWRVHFLERFLQME
jgi:cation-transporting ATPase E